MNALTGIKNFLNIVDLYWVDILVVLGIIVGIVKKTIAYFSKSKEERLLIAKNQIAEIILAKVKDAETRYADWNKAGEIKRAEVIQELYEEYPILSKVAEQAELTIFIDTAIDNALIELRKVIEENKEKFSAE